MQQESFDIGMSLSPGEEAKLMDDVQKESNRDIKSLLPCDPCLDALADGIDSPEEAEPVDVGLGVEADLYDF